MHAAMRVAVIADIHGNVAALEAVLADIRTRRVDRIVNLGDVASGPLWPRETMQLLAEHAMPTVRGNHDRSVSGPDRDRMGAADRYAYGELDDAHRQWLGALPMTIDVDDGILAFHATPADDLPYLIEEVHDRRLVRARHEAIRERLGDVRARIVLCGHSHLQHLIQLPDGPLIANPGSVGCPAGAGGDYVAEAGSPHARYAVLTIRNARPEVEMIAITYPWEEAARRAEANGRGDWAHGLRTGFMPR
jgi:predicted phosphodiesterase